MILVIPDAGLAQIIASPTLLAQIWPGAADEVMMFIQVLRMSVPSLADALTVGLISILSPPAGTISAQIFLAYGRAVLSAMAVSETGEWLAAPHLQTAEVVGLDITDLSVGGRSGLRLAG